MTDLTPILMPQSIEAEVAVLGSILINPGEALDQAVALLSSPCFYQRSHQIIFAALSDMHSKGEPVDTVTVTTRLKDAGTLEECGGPYYLSKLSVAFPTSAHVRYYIDVLREKWRLRRIIELSTQSIERCYSQEDSMETVGTMEQEFIELSQGSSCSENHLEPAVAELHRQIELRKSGKTICGLETGILALDKLTGGLHDTTMTLLAGRPSMGKSAMLDQIVLTQLERNIPCLYIGLESSLSRIVGKIVAKRLEIPWADFVRSDMTPANLSRMERCAGWLKTSSLILKRPASLSVSELRSMIRMEHRRHGIKLFVLDYIQKLYGGTDPDKERLMLAAASQQIQQACVETGVPALVAVQLNRSSEKNARPSMSDLKGSGQLEQDADSIFILWSDKVRETWDANQLFPTFLTVAKHKDGRCGDLELLHDMRLMIFRTPEKRGG